jgi:hypothetical protein
MAYDGNIGVLGGFILFWPDVFRWLCSATDFSRDNWFPAKLCMVPALQRASQSLVRIQTGQGWIDLQLG